MSSIPRRGRMTRRDFAMSMLLETTPHHRYIGRDSGNGSVVISAGSLDEAMALMAALGLGIESVREVQT